MMLPRKNHPLVHDVMSLDREWKKKYMFMKVGDNPGFRTAWSQRAISTDRCEVGSGGYIKAVRELPEHRSVQFLTSDLALSCCTIWGCNVMKNQPRLGIDVNEQFRQASEAKMAEINKLLPPPGPVSASDVLNTRDPHGKHKAVEVAAISTTYRGLKAANNCSSTIPSSFRLVTTAYPTPFSDAATSSFVMISMCNYLKERPSCTM